MARPLRIITGGIHHETNSFTPLPTIYRYFTLSCGPERYADDAGNLAPLDQIDLATTFVANAGPGGLVQHTTYQQLKTELLAEIAAALPADGLLLDLHGAMEVEQIGDGETDLLLAVRALVGEHLPIAISLDLHGNISPALIAGAQILTAYRTAPHRDANSTRRRALQLLIQALSNGHRPVSAMVKLPLMLPGEAAVTDVEPAASLYQQLPAIAQLPGLLDASLMIGCAWTDSRYARVSAIVVAESDAQLAQMHAAQLADRVWERRAQFGYAIAALDVDAAIAQAQRSTTWPVYISDSGDNVTAGAPGDSPLLAARLLASGAQALIAGIADQAAVQACVAAGVGAELELSIGASLDPRSGPALACRAIVEQIGAANAVVRSGNLRIIVTSERQAFTERADISAAGVDPHQQQIIVVKLGYLFPDLVAHAAHAIMALTPGATTLRLETLPYQQVTRPIYPLDPQIEWEAGAAARRCPPAARSGTRYRRAAADS